MTEDERRNDQQPDPEQQQGDKEGGTERKILHGSETRKLSEDYEYKPPKTLRPVITDLDASTPSPEEAPQQETPQE